MDWKRLQRSATRREFIVGAAAAAASVGWIDRAGAQEGLAPLSPDLNAETQTSGGLAEARLSALISRGVAPQRAKRLSRQPEGALSQHLSKNFVDDLQPTLWRSEAALVLHAAPATSSQSLTYGNFRIRWPDDQESVDIRHLLSAETTILGGPAGKDSSFSLTPALLSQLCSNNGFLPLSRDKAPCVLFGIRGAVPESDDSGWTTSAKLRLDAPNDFERRCVLGVWYRGTDRPECVRVFPGSTVPNARYMVEQASSASTVSNLPPTGFHRFVVGALHQKIMGVFTQGASYPAHRLPHRTFEQSGLDELKFTNAITTYGWPQLASRLPIDTVGVDIHPAFLDDDPIQFSSAGCQVVRGTQKVRISDGGQVAQGAWESFRTAAGLKDPPVASENGRQFDYLLVSAREALATAQASPVQQPLLARWRFGSVDGPPRASPFPGLTVKAFQQALVAACRQPGTLADRVSHCALPSDFATDGRFFGGTMRLALSWQADKRGYADGIVDREMLSALGLG